MSRPHAIHHTTAPTVLHTLVTLTCPTTGRAYTVDDALVALVGDQVVFWSRCAWCDALGRICGDVGYLDAAPPQAHAQLVS